MGEDKGKNFDCSTSTFNQTSSLINSISEILLSSIYTLSIRMFIDFILILAFYAWYFAIGFPSEFLTSSFSSHQSVLHTAASYLFRIQS